MSGIRLAGRFGGEAPSARRWGSLAGGLAAAFVSLTLVASASASTAVFSPTGPMAFERAGQAAVTLADGRILTLGGYDSEFDRILEAEIYDPESGTFATTGSMEEGRIGPVAVALASGDVLVAGGSGDAGCLNGAELFDPASGTFSATGSMTTGRCTPAFSLLADGRVLVAGGNQPSGFPTDTAEIYDPETGTFSATGSMASARRGNLPAVLLEDGRVLVSGGENAAGSLATAELFDPESGTFSPAANSMTDPRTDGMAVRLGDGKVLVAGGVNIVGGSTAAWLASADLFDPASDTFTQTGSLADPKVFATITRLDDGRVLVAGGGTDSGSGYSTSTTEIYDPEAGTFSAGPSMGQTRTSQAAALLDDGRVLIAGGESQDFLSLTSAELFRILKPRFTALRLKAGRAKARRGGKVGLTISLTNAGSATGTATVRLFAGPRKAARVKSKLTFRIPPGRTVRRSIKATITRKAGRKVIFKARSGNLARQVRVKVKR